MRSVSQQYQALAEGDGALYYAKIVCGNDEITSGIRQIVFNYRMESQDSISFGNYCSNYVSITIYDPSVNLEEKDIALYLGLQVGDSIEYLKMGQYTVNKNPTIKGKLYQYTAYDAMMKLETVYIPKISFPATAAQVKADIASQYGLTIQEPVSGVTIEKKPLGYTAREVIGYIAGLEGKNACADADGNIVFRWYSGTYAIGGKYYESGLSKDSENDFSIQKITCTVGAAESGEAITCSSGGGNMGISVENPFMTQAAIDKIYASMGGFSFRGTTISFIGNPLIELGDIITAIDIDTGKTVKIPAMIITHTYDGGLKTEVQALAKTDATSTPQGPNIMAMQRYAIQLAAIEKAVISKLDADEAAVKYATIESLSAVDARVKTLEADKITVTYLNANYAKISDLEAAKGRITELESTRVTTEFLQANYITAKDIEAAYAKISSLNAAVARIGTLESNQITTEYLNANYAKLENLTAVTARVDSLESSQITADYLSANYVSAKNADAKYATITELESANAKITNIESSYLRTENAEIAYARIDKANIPKAWIDQAMIADGVVGTVQIADGSITDAKIVGMTANKITAGKIDAAEIEVVNLNAANITVGTINGQQISDGAIDSLKLASGSVISDKISDEAVTSKHIHTDAVTADKIVSGAVTADKIAANAVTANAILAGAITTDKLDARAITADKIAANTIKTENIALDALKSVNYVDATGNYSAAGTYFNLSDGTIKSKNFSIDSEGNGRFKGVIESSSGTIAGFTISGNKISASGIEISCETTDGGASSIGEAKIKVSGIEISPNIVSTTVGGVKFEYSGGVIQCGSAFDTLLGDSGLVTKKGYFTSELYVNRLEVKGAIDSLNSKLNVTVKYYEWLPDTMRGISTSEFRSAAPNGVSFYGTNPNVHLSDVNDKISSYGTLINFKNGGYMVTLYSDVFGNLQTYSSQLKKWNKPFALIS